MENKRRDFLKKSGLGVSALAFGGIGSWVHCEKQERLPNIVLILTDDQGYHDVNCYGAVDIKTPNLDQLASEGMRFTDFYVSQAVCSASRASLLTGCYAERVSLQGALMPWASIGLNPQEETIADLLKGKGYATGIFGKWHLGHHEEFLPTRQGFDEYLGLPYSNDMWPIDYDGTPVDEDNHKKQYPPLPLMKNEKQIDTINTLEDQSTLTTRYTKAAVNFIKKNKNHPFFLYVPHAMPHVPLGVSDKFKGKSEYGLYGDVIMEIDWSVGEIVKTLENNNLTDNTLVIFASDNGPWLSFGNHAGRAAPLREGKGTMFEGGPRVPCIMKWPGKIEPGRVCSNIAASIDILPTVAAIADAKLPERKIDGVSLLPLLTNKRSVSVRDVYYYYYGGGLRAIRKGDWKLQFPHRTRTYKNTKVGMDGFPGEELYVNVPQKLYNLMDDIGETTDLSQKYPEKVKELEALGEIARDQLGDQITGAVGKEIREPGRTGLKDNPRVEHLAKDKKVKVMNPYHPKYSGGGDMALVNGIKGELDLNDGSWQGYEHDDLEMVVDLEKEEKVSFISVGFFESQGSWIFRPKSLVYSVSKDGIQYEEVFRKKVDLKKNGETKIWEFPADFLSQEARYIKVKAENTKVCPNWHIGKGGRAWLFCDEIVVK